MALKTVLLICFVFGLTVCRVRANDANWHGVGGRWQLVKGEHRQIQMVRERVCIVPRGDEFQTTADFVFRNHGPATTVKMGFPESQGGVDAEGPEALPRFRQRPTLSHFRSWVDGRLVKVQRHVNPNTLGTVRALWLKTVHFQRNQTHRVRVRYISSCGGGASDGEMWVSYQFTGGNWRGEVEESLLDVQLPRGAYLLPYRAPETRANPQRQQWGNKFRFRWTHWQAQNDFELAFFPIFPNDLLLHSHSASIARAAKPFYYDHKYLFGRSLLLPVVRGNGRAECILSCGRLWIAASSFAPRWDEKRRAVILTSGKKKAFISARGATRRSALWPLAPNGTFWISDLSQNNSLMIPARQILRHFGGRFEFNFQHGHAIWVRGKERKIIPAIART